MYERPRVLRRDTPQDTITQWQMLLINPAHSCGVCEHDGNIYDWDNNVCNDCYFKPSRPNFEQKNLIPELEHELKVLTATIDRLIDERTELALRIVKEKKDRVKFEKRTFVCSKFAECKKDRRDISSACEFVLFCADEYVINPMNCMLFGGCVEVEQKNE